MSIVKSVNCRCCGGEVKKIFTGVIFNSTITYFECSVCSYVQTESPYWLDRAYDEPINVSDTGIMVRNQMNANIALATLWVLEKLDGRLVDCAGGYGLLVRMLRDSGVEAHWDDRYCKNILAKGFEYKAGNADLVTAFEAFEHFLNPAAELDRLLDISTNVLFSTEIIQKPAPLQNDWWYYGKEHGQHIGFFRIETLEKLARERGKFLVSNGFSYHLITDKPVNQRLWNYIIRFNHFASIILKRRLVSKVWADHNLIVEREKNANCL
jgi:hypothetical protein